MCVGVLLPSASLKGSLEEVSTTFALPYPQHGILKSLSASRSGAFFERVISCSSLLRFGPFFFFSSLS